jgi:prepilin-type N-terminal cleavage/methylation domain-containing protein
MKTHSQFSKRGFTLLETVIAIGVLAVLLTGFMIVFAPAAAGIKKAINVQDADRLASTLEQELVVLRGTAETTEYKTGFGKAFEWLKDSNTANDALMIYQYRGSLTSLRTSDNTPEPVETVNDKLPGKDYMVLTMVRRQKDALFKEDLKAIEGGVFVVKCTQLVFDTGATGGLKEGTAGTIKDPKTGTAAANSDVYPEAVIAFAAEFFSVPSKAAAYFGTGGKFGTFFTKANNPVFTRNLAVRR